MLVRDLPPEQFYALAAKALFGTPRDKKRTKFFAALIGDSCQGLMQELWIRLAEQGKDTGDFKPSTFIFHNANWMRSFRRADDRRKPTRTERVKPSMLVSDGDVSQDASQHQLIVAIERLLRTLNYREKLVIQLRYGLSPDRFSYTLDQCGRILNVCRERIRQIESKAICKLRHHRRADKLIQFAEDLGYWKPLPSPEDAVLAVEPTHS